MSERARSGTSICSHADSGKSPIRWAALEFAPHGHNLHTLFMTAAGKHILEDFESLPDLEKREVLANP